MNVFTDISSYLNFIAQCTLLNIKPKICFNIYIRKDSMISV